MTAFYERVVLNSNYADIVRRLQIENELYMLRGESGERYAQYIGVNREVKISSLERELESMGGTDK